MKRLSAALVLVLALAAFAAGCGGDDSSDGGDEAVEPATWASGFCDALKTFTTGISEAGSDLTGEGIPSSDEIIEVIDNAATAASTFADDLRELGRPDVPSGEEIQNELETAAIAPATTATSVAFSMSSTSSFTASRVSPAALAAVSSSFWIFSPLGTSGLPSSRRSSANVLAAVAALSTTWMICLLYTSPSPRD